MPARSSDRTGSASSAAARSKLAFAELGIAFLLFLVGLELSPGRLWQMRRAIFGLGMAQVVVTGLVLTGLIYLTLGFSPAASLALGLPLALSSTAQVLPGLKSSGRINSPFGEKAFSILLFRDLAIVPMITIIAVLSRAPADPSAPPGWQMAFFTVWAIVVLVLAGRLRRQSAAAHRRPLWRTRTVRRRRPADDPRQRGADAQPAPLDRARRLHRRRDAG